MSEVLGESLVIDVINDPHLKKHFLSKLQDPLWRVPEEYEEEVKHILRTQVSLIPTISGVDDFKVLVEALNAVTMAKTRVAQIAHHTKSLHYRWSKLLRQATRYIEREYYERLNSVKDSIRKAVLAGALETLEEGVQQVKHLLDLAELAQTHLNDVNWAVKNSSDLTTNYFNAIARIEPRTVKDL